jgi:hypothetical protein
MAIVSLEKFKKLAIANPNMYLSKSYPGSNYRAFIFAAEGMKIEDISETVAKTLIERGILAPFPMYQIVNSKLSEIG